MSKVRIGIVGLGNMGASHAASILAGKIPRLELTAVSDFDPSRCTRFPQVKAFATAEELIESGTIDAVIIATPHYQHTTLGIQALKAGLHVMVEKPVSVHEADAERLIAAQKQEAGLRGDVQPAHRPLLPEDPQSHPLRRARRNSPCELDHHELVSHRSLLRIRRLARHLGRRRPASPPRPVPA